MPRQGKQNELPISKDIAFRLNRFRGHGMQPICGNVAPLNSVRTLGGLQLLGMADHGSTLEEFVASAVV
ncbi:hypothetical protein D3C71_1909870 [compost metagenome]